MFLPRISTFAGRSVVRSVSGVLHDAVWLVETRVVETRVTCVIDGTAVVAPPEQRGRQRAVLGTRTQGGGMCAIGGEM